MPRRSRPRRYDYVPAANGGKPLPEQAQKECTKTVFGTESGAWAAIKLIRANPDRTKKVPHRVVWCDEHRGYHLTSRRTGVADLGDLLS